MFVFVGLTCASAADNQTYEITAIENDAVTNQVLSVETGNFTDLNNEITGKNEYKLIMDYTYIPEEDANFKNGIVISKDNFVLDGDSHTINAAGQARIFNITSKNVTLKNINFINGNSAEGGAIYSSANIVIENCNFTNNTAKYSGGALYLENTKESSIQNSNFMKNKVTGRVNGGGALYFKQNDNIFISKCSFENNSAYFGGAVYWVNGTGGSFYNSKFVNNRASNGGGSIYLEDVDDTSVSGCYFKYGNASDEGGFIYCIKSDYFSVSNTSFDNTTAYDGGTIYFDRCLYASVYNCTIENCRVGSDGAGIYGNFGFDDFPNCDYAIITNCSFVNCSNMMDTGGAICWYGADTIISNCSFENIYCDDRGGAIWLTGERNTIFNCSFENCHSWGGGAICLENIKDSNITQCLFINTFTTSNGGAINCYDRCDNVRISNCNFINTSTDRQYGGAIYDSGDNSYIYNCSFVNATAYSGGAIYRVSGKNAYVYNCTFINNSAKKGGAIRSDILLTIVECDFINTFTYNEFEGNEGGGAVSCRDVVVVNSTFKDTQSNKYGGAIYAERNLNITNSIFTNNSASDGGAVYCVLNGSVTDSIFKNTHASNNGGAIYFSKNGTVENSNFINNAAVTNGGAVYLSQFGIVKNSNFTSNTANNDGGAVFFKVDGNVTDSNFAYNEAGNRAGGVCSLGGFTTIINSNFTHCISRGWIGGAIYLEEGLVDNCNVSHSQTLYYGAAIRFNNVRGIVKNSIFINNTATSDREGSNGGAIYFNNGTVENCVFIENHINSVKSGTGGGAIFFNHEGNVINSNFTRNTANQYGGAIFFAEKGTVISCNFENNDANEGGALFLNSKSTVNDSTFNNNHASNGGAIFVDESITPEFKNLIFTGNSANNGGAIYIDYDATVMINNFSFVSNTALNNGGAIYAYERATAMIDNSTFDSNSADNNGGAIYIYDDANAIIGNSTFDSNSADNNGGAICIYDDANAIIGNSTFDSNDAGYGGAIYLNDEGLINNSIFTDNYASNDGGSIYLGEHGTVDYSNFTNNNARNEGGAIYAVNTLNLKHSVFTYNRVNNYGGAVYCNGEGNVEYCDFRGSVASKGGAVYFNETGSVKHSGFILNEAYYDGGAIYFNYVGEVDYCNFNASIAGEYGRGGAIFCLDEILINNSNFRFNGIKIHGQSGAVHIDKNGTVNNCTFDKNYAPSAGAISFSEEGTVTNSYFVNNTAETGQGGAIVFNNGGLVDCSNFDNNTAYNGGAISFTGIEGLMIVNNSKFTNNKATMQYGGAIDGINYPLVLSNSILLNNKAKSNAPIFYAYDFSVMFSGLETFINAIRANENATFKNVTYWNGEIVNSDEIAPVLNRLQGINITMEVYDNENNLVDNVTLMTDETSCAFYTPYHLNDGYYKIKAYHRDDSYYYTSGDALGSFNLNRNSSLVEINITDNDEFFYGEFNISFNIENHTEVRVVITNNTGNIIVDEIIDNNYITVNLIPDDYNITVYNLGNEIFAPSHNSKLFKILKIPSKVNITPIGDIVYGNKTVITFNVEYPTEVDVIVYDENENIVFKMLNCDEFSVTVPVLPVGKYNVTIINKDTEIYEGSVNSTIFQIVKANNTVKVEVNDAIYGTGVIVNVIADADGEYLLNVNGTDKKVNVINGKGNVTFTLDAGSYWANATFDNGNYSSNITNATFNVFKANSSVTITPMDDVGYGKEIIITFNVEYPTEVDVIVYDENENIVFSELNCNKSSVTIPILPRGKYNVTITNKDTKNYVGSVNSTVFHVIKSNNTVKLVADDVIYGTDVVVNVIADADGEYLVNMSGTIKKVNVTNGKGNVTFTLNAGSYWANATFGNENYLSNITNATFNVFKANVLITAVNKEYVINYGGKYSVTLKDVEGIVFTGQKVTFTLNGKVIGSAVSDANGIATITLTAKILKTVKAGKKNLVIRFNGAQNYNAMVKTVKITVKKEKTKIKAKKKTFKKTKKVKKYAITLKNSKGKAVKKVKVTLKIKGKTFKAKTNSKGKATFKIKKLTKKGTYKAKIIFKATASYLKAAKTVKIKLR